MAVGRCCCVEPIQVTSGNWDLIFENFYLNGTLDEKWHSASGEAIVGRQNQSTRIPPFLDFEERLEATWNTAGGVPDWSIYSKVEIDIISKLSIFEHLPSFVPPPYMCMLFCLSIESPFVAPEIDNAIWPQTSEIGPFELAANGFFETTTRIDIKPIIAEITGLSNIAFLIRPLWSAAGQPDGGYSIDARPFDAPSGAAVFYLS